jgi:hypothetical protein
MVRSPESPCAARACDGHDRIRSCPSLWPASHRPRSSPGRGIPEPSRPCAQPGGGPHASGERAVDNCGPSVEQPCTGSSCPRGARVVPEFSPGSIPRARTVATCGCEGYPHNPQHLLLRLFLSSKVVNKEKTGGAGARTHASRSGSIEAWGRLERRSRTLYGDEQRMLFLEAASAPSVTPRGWKGIS